MSRVKRVNHEGTFYKEDRNGTTLFCWKIRLGSEAKPIVRKRKTQAALTTAVKAVRRELEDTGQLVSASDDPTIKERMIQWLELKVKPNRARKTHASYKQVCDLYIFPAIGKIKLSKLTALHIQQVVAHVQKLKLSGRTANYAVAVLRSGIGRKVKNLLDDVELPASSAPRDRVLDDEHEIPAFLAECFRERELKTRPGEMVAVHRDRFLIAFLLNSGLRINEALGLLNVDFNASKAIVMVSKQLDLQKGGEWTLAETKGKKSREVPLSEHGAAALAGQRQLLAAEKARAGKGYEDNGFLFPTESGRPQNARNVRRSLDAIFAAVNAARTEQGLGEFAVCTIHDLRRSYGTYLADREERMQVVSALMGHQNANTTLKHYVRARERSKVEAAQKINFGLPSVERAKEVDAQAKQGHPQTANR